MPKFAVIHTYEYTKTMFLDAKDADEASEIANGKNPPGEFVESDHHNFTDEVVQEEE